MARGVAAFASAGTLAGSSSDLVPPARLQHERDLPAVRRPRRRADRPAAAAIGRRDVQIARRAFRRAALRIEIDNLQHAAEMLRGPLNVRDVRAVGRPRRVPFVGIRRHHEVRPQPVVAHDHQVVVAAAAGLIDDPPAFRRPPRRAVGRLARVAAARRHVRQSLRLAAACRHAPDATLAHIGQRGAVRRPRDRRLAPAGRRQRRGPAAVGRHQHDLSTLRERELTAVWRQRRCADLLHGEQILERDARVVAVGGERDAAQGEEQRSESSRVHGFTASAG